MPAEPLPKPHPLWLGFVIAYVAVVLVLDTAAFWTGWGRAWFDWDLGTFDLFKFVMWFVVPFALALPGMDWRFLGLKRWSKCDVALLVGLTVAGALAMFTISFVPGLQDYYQSQASRPWEYKVDFVQRQLIWYASWLIGWEFMHRYFLLRPAEGFWPGYGWVLVPVREVLYHLQKHPLEAVGMGALSVVLTLWTLKRRNFLVPFLVHLIIEIELVLFLILV